VFAVAGWLAVACGGGLQQDPVTDVRSMAPLAYGDCVEARRRAAVDPDLAVDRLPTPLRQNPAPLRGLPPAVKNHVDRQGAVVKVHVLVDTLGRPVMRTFSVDTTSHPWLSDNVKSVIPRWRFRPALLAGCKVARVYKFSATRSKQGR
jgi:hypothetical protein